MHLRTSNSRSLSMLQRLKATGVSKVRGEMWTERSTAAFKPSKRADPSSPCKALSAGPERVGNPSIAGHLMQANVSVELFQIAIYAPGHRI